MRRLTDVSFEYSGFAAFSFNNSFSPQMSDERSKNILSKLSIYTKLFVVSSIYLINRAYKKQVLSVYSSHYLSIYFWI